MPTDQSISRRHARDFSHLPPVLLRSDRFPLPNYNKALPSIPSTSTGLEDSDAVSVFTSLSGSLTISPTPSRDAYERTSLTEAQRIAAQYRERHREAPNVFRNVAVSGSTVRDVNSNPLEFQYASLSSTVLESGARVDGRAVNATVATSSAPQSPPMRWAPAAEIETTHEAVSRFGRVHDDGTVSCAWEDCLGVLPSLAAFLSHLHVHLIHEGYVARLRRVLIWIWSTDHVIRQLKCL